MAAYTFKYTPRSSDSKRPAKFSLQDPLTNKGWNTGPPSQKSDPECDSHTGIFGSQRPHVPTKTLTIQDSKKNIEK